ncbi:hypothetical protein MRX96_049070 [Rhipicephalus microplus]
MQSESGERTFEFPFDCDALERGVARCQGGYTKTSLHAANAVACEPLGDSTAAASSSAVITPWPLCQPRQCDQGLQSFCTEVGEVTNADRGGQRRQPLRQGSRLGHSASHDSVIKDYSHSVLRLVRSQMPIEEDSVGSRYDRDFRYDCCSVLHEGGFVHLANRLVTGSTTSERGKARHGCRVANSMC